MKRTKTFEMLVVGGAAIAGVGSGGRTPRSHVQSPAASDPPRASVDTTEEERPSGGGAPQGW